MKISTSHKECFMRDKCSIYAQCPMIVVQDIISGKWKILILWYLSYSKLRFSDLQKKLPDVSQKVLSSQLKSLEEYNIINRTVYAVVPPKVEYSLTETGKQLVPLLEMMHQFGADYLDQSFENK